MNQSPSQTNLTQEVQTRIENAFLKAEAVYGRKFDRAKISFDIRFGAGKAGTAQVMPFRQIKINPQLLRQNPTHVLDVTCPHEVAHLVAFDLYGVVGWGHGPKWKGVMTNIGLPPKRCHSLVTVASLGKAVYECNNCNKQTLASRAVHWKVANNKIKLSPCKCRGEYQFKGSVGQLVKNKTLTCLELPE